MSFHGFFCTGRSIILILLIAAILCITTGADLPGQRNASSEPFSFLGDIPAVLTGQGTDRVVIHFFYNPGCGACEKIHPVIDEYEAGHPEVEIVRHSLAGNRTSVELFTAFQEAYNITHAHVPILFLGRTTLMGDEDIAASLDQTVRETRSSGPRDGLLPQYHPSGQATGPSSINLPVLLLAAIGEGLNPCGLLVLALLLVSLFSSASRRTALFIGLAYIVAFFAVRLLSGFAIFSVIQIPGISETFIFVAAAVAIVAGIIQVADGLAKKKHALLSIPESKKGIISVYMKKASVPAGLVVGALVGIYGMACTAGIYISILGMIYQEPVTGLLYLILYNLVVIIPLLAILLLVFFGIPPEKINSWRDEQKSMLRVMIGVVMIVMGIIILIPVL